MSALVDGRSIVTIQKNQLWLQHLDWTAPGREGGRNVPTSVNGEKWYPTWSTWLGEDVRGGRCISSSLGRSLANDFPRYLGRSWSFDLPS